MPVLKESLGVGIVLLIWTWVVGYLLEPFIIEQMEFIAEGEDIGLMQILLTFGSLFVMSYLGPFLMGLILSQETSISITTLVLGLWIHTFSYYTISVAVMYFSGVDFLSFGEWRSAFITGIIAGTLVGSLGYYIGQKIGAGEDYIYE